MRLFHALAAFGSGWLLLGCPQFPGDLCEEITCNFTDGGEDGSRPPTDGAIEADGGNVDSGPDAPTCDSARSPKDAPCVVDDAFGIFVSDATGVDGNAGTRAAPKKTIGAALLAAKSAGKRVFVCEGTYAESVVIDTSKDGERLYGGLACATWTYDATKRPLVKPATGIALRLTQVTDVRIEDVAFTAPDGAGPGQSSIAAFAASAGAGVVLRRVALTAGKGVNGAPGALGVTGTSTPADQTGNAGTALAGGDAKSCTCSTGGSSVGGKGGFNMSVGNAGSPALPENPPGQTPPQDGAGGMANTSCVAGLGHTGADAPIAGDGAGAATLGVLDGVGWTPASGLRGVSGSPGQGGGGGGSRGPAGGAGSGGCGACGGGGGGNGGGGGASIAFLAVDSPVVLEQCEVASAKAGDGGGGATGADGQQAAGAGGNATGLACPGGDGGKGGKGGAGGGGAGGVSVGVAYKGPAPSVDAATQGQITVGAAGLSGTGGGAKPSLAGIAGDAKAVRPLP